LQRRKSAEPEFLDHDVEGAKLVAMRPEHALPLNIEGRCRKLLRHRHDLGRRDVEEYGVGVDETPNEPRTGDTVNLRARSCHPNRAAVAVSWRQDFDRHHRVMGRGPGERAALKCLGLSA
jgi:hypothetical protein